MTFEKIRQAALKLPDVEEGTAWGFPAFRVRKKMFLCFREDLGAVLMHTPIDQRDAMIAEEPETLPRIITGLIHVSWHAWSSCVQPCCRICCRWHGSMRRR